MKLKSLKYKNSEIVFGDKLISFDDNGISIDLDDGIAKKLAILDFFELVEEEKAKKEVKEEPKEEVKETETKKRATNKKTTK
ncbi:hypothetical protein QP531_06510 [Peptoniphilus harei]|uniref:hypothetical protein n=1 Tax=Peptoniphilus harei TaxID=54005 RepID=UPI00254CDC41|nr:hypothetical protein [Peptoniphilus harei]MDK7377468.1 hypothetical protein [Peptoniphilus harei]MDK7679780.1 hypothetical protein [Peptoniphilus harei]